MADGTREFHVRQRNRTPAREPFPLPPPLQRMLDLGKATLAAPFKGVTADGTATPGLFRLEKTGHSLQPVVDAARAFLMSMPPDQRATARFDLSSPMWQAWCNIHPFMMRHGICLADLGGEQRERALALMRASMSESGYRTACDVMKLNGHVLEFTNRPDEYGEWLYWVSIMGEPSGSTPWGWQIDGHHLIVNCFVLGDQMVLTPNFMGSEPVHASTGKFAGTTVFAEEERKGFVLMSAFTPEQRAQATLGLKLPFDVMTTAFHDNDVMPYQGVRYGDMSKEQRDLLERLIGLYTGRIRPGHAEIRYAEAKRHLDDTWFAWIGPCDDVSAFYYRVHSPAILIEFDHQPGIVYDNDEHTRNHVHTIVRTPNGNDYGKDLLRLHYAQQDHADPRSPHRQGKA
ncbi:MAG TPA: DUF3500 domain-containing protein [Stellaceae bacterium]|nr:DUF3500 domain-containing protein [Stellaceae bacterium]